MMLPTIVSSLMIVAMMAAHGTLLTQYCGLTVGGGQW